MALIFGFDIGTTSIGWAVIEYGPPHVVDQIRRLGVRIFPEARDRDQTPRNQERRKHRLARRQYRRRRARRKALNEALFEAGLLPRFGTPEWSKVMTCEPTALRKKGLTEELEPYALGRALYHLAQRRHFKGRDALESESEETPDEKKANVDRESTRKKLKEQGQTLGEYLAAKMPAPGEVPFERHRGTQAGREHVAEEFRSLWDTQSPYHAVLRDSDFQAHVTDVMFAQLPVFWRRKTLGKCRFVPDADPCPKGTWLSQQRRMLDDLNKLLIVGGNPRRLDGDERSAILNKLQFQHSMTAGSVRTLLKPIFKARGEAGREKRLRFNLEEGVKSGGAILQGNSTEANLAAIFEDGWLMHPHRQAIRDAIHDRLWDANYDKIGKQRVVIRSEVEQTDRRIDVAASFIADFGVTAAQANAMANLKLPSGWEPFSAEALRHFLPHLEEGVQFGALLNSPDWEDWRATTFPNRTMPTGEILNRLPSPKQKEEQLRLGALRNPTVVRVQNELRKVVNNLISVYGKPDRIRVELAREIGMSKLEREKRQNDMLAQGDRRKRAAADLAEKHAETTPRYIEKWLLWQECQHCCPYTGAPICFDALFGSSPEFDIEHIWPRSRTSGDNSFGNKTLARREVNQRKGDKTPFEYFEHRPDEWPGIVNRLGRMVAAKGEFGMSPAKARRFLAECIPQGFAERQLNDTRFASRQAIGFLKRLWPDVENGPVYVQPVTGRVTDQLRRLWMLNNILPGNGEKTRSDHRHHAIDALVVACADPGMTKKLSVYWQKVERSEAQRPPLDAPWADIRTDAQRKVEKIVVSHRVKSKVSGPMHNGMPFGYTQHDITKNGVALGIYVKRMPVQALSLATLKNCRIEDISTSGPFFLPDGRIRQALRAHLEATGKPAAKAYPPFPRVSPNGPEIRKVRVHSGRQKDLMVETAKGFAPQGEIHHIAIYLLPNGESVFDAVSREKASRRLSRHEPIVRRKRDDGATFVMSLSAGDTVELREGEKPGLWVVQKIASKGQITLSPINDARPASETEAKRQRMSGKREEFEPMVNGILARRGRKLSIDPIGRIRIAGD